ncbi:type II secretion system F family protein [Dactylosporangium sp. CS-047395]|uniref:type II secretion system F family protein n=1 Tax=Dactylosporangium sp. CS-047395 TaxID=3239936 RepID=UPI003D94D48D
MMLRIALAALGAAIFLGACAVLPHMFRTAMQRRLYELRRFGGQRNGRSRAGELAAALRRAATANPNQGWRARTRARLERAALPWTEWQWVSARLVLTAAVLVVLVFVSPWYVAVALALLTGALAPGVLLRVRVARRKAAFAEDLPETLRLAVSSLRSGFTLQHAIAAAANEGSGVVADELRRALNETRLGGNLEDALERLADRTGNHDVIWLVMAIRIQREVGGNLSDVLQTTTDTMRERAQLQRHVMTLSAEGRLSAMILFALPIVVGAWLLVFRTDYVRPLYTEPLGIVMLVYSAVSLAAGALWLRAVIRIDV